MKNATLMDLMYAVTHDDKFDGVMLSSDVLLVLEIAFLKLGLSSLGSPVRLELSNGEALCISVEGKTPTQMKFSVQELRPEVLAFALLMELRLREKDADRGGNSWQNATLIELFTPMMSKAIAVEKAIFRTKESPNKHAIDLANYCMMIADVAGALQAGAEDISGNGGPGWEALDQVQMP
ncbi:MAG: hypothetical protein AB1722_12380 [Pseudomonadota bacterium]